MREYGVRSIIVEGMDGVCSKYSVLVVGIGYWVVVGGGT